MLTQVEKLLSGRALTRRSIIILFTLIMGWIDLATGYEYSFSVFYLIPVSVPVIGVSKTRVISSSALYSKAL